MSKRIFIGSAGSPSSLEIAKKIAKVLELIGASVTIWNQENVFPIGVITIENIINISKNFHGGLFIFNKDDQITPIEDQIYTARDNVIIEAGIFIGALGKEAVAICKVSGVKKISDLDGLTYLRYEPNDIPSMYNKLESWLERIPYNNVKPNVKPTVLFEKRAAVEERLPILQRFENRPKQIDICCIAGIGLFSYPGVRDRLECLIKRGCKVRFVINTPDSHAALEAARIIIRGGPYEQRKMLISNTLNDLLLWKKHYGKLFSVRTTNLSLPCSIFRVITEHDEDSSVKVDFYSFNCNTDERRCVYIKYNNEEDFIFYERQFEYIYENAHEVELPN